MTKPQITRIWLIGVAVFVVGLIIFGVSMGLMFAYGGQYVPAARGSGYDFVPTLDGFFWTTVGFMILGGIVAIGGAIAQLVAWIGALMNTNALQDKTWFIVLLAGGLIGLMFGLVYFAVMVAYVIAGPDATLYREPRVPVVPTYESPRSGPTPPTYEPPRSGPTPLAPTA